METPIPGSGAWRERASATIVEVAGKIPDDVLQEDPKLLMWYDQALTRTEAGRAVTAQPGDWA